MNGIYIYNETSDVIFFKPIFPRGITGTAWISVRPSLSMKVWDVVPEEMHVVVLCEIGIYIYSQRGYTSIIVDDKIDRGVDALYKTSDIFPIGFSDFLDEIPVKDLLRINCNLKDIMRFAEYHGVHIIFS